MSNTFIDTITTTRFVPNEADKELHYQEIKSFFKKAFNKDFKYYHLEVDGKEIQFLVELNDNPYYNKYYVITSTQVNYYQTVTITYSDLYTELFSNQTENMEEE